MKINSIVTLGIYIIFTYSLITAQNTSFYDIRENLLNENPQSGNTDMRYNLFSSIDDLIMGTYPPLHPNTKWFFSKMLDKAIIEIKTEQVFQGATVWQIYNHGFVIKTPSITFGIDLHDYFRTESFAELADLIDAYFITHEHNDHFSFELIASMQKQNKPVVGPAEFQHALIKMSKGESRTVAGLMVTAHDGLHGNIPLRQYEIITTEGIKILHTGDNQTTETLPQISDVDIMMLNSWINESGGVSWIEGVRLAIDKIKPDVTLPGHMMELAHLGQTYPPVPYRDPIASDNGNLASDYCILAWGEKYNFGFGSVDYIRPNIVSSLSAEAFRDSILVSWDITEATDGDKANFYRVIIDHVPDTFLTQTQLVHPIDELRTYNFKVLSYDNWGNQSIDWAQLDFNASPEINYPPRIINTFPSIEDSINTFAGVISFFKVEAIDFNNDELEYNWKLDNQEIEDHESTTEIDFFDVESGPHILSVIINDSMDSTTHSWNIYHHKDSAIVDNEDSVMYNDFGEWKTFTQQKAYGISCRTSGVNNIGDYAKYKFYPPKNGMYDIFQIIIQTTYASNNVLYKILSDNKIIDSIYIDQNYNSGNWSKIGNYPFFNNSEVTIQIINDGSATEGYSIVSDAIKFVYTGEITDIEINNNSLDNFSLSQNYPNPFNPSTTISYSVPSLSVMLSSFQHLNNEIPNHTSTSSVSVRDDNVNVVLRVYDVLGRIVATIVNQKQNSGNYEVTWDGLSGAGRQVPSGVYFYQLTANDLESSSGQVFVETKKMLMIK